MGRIGTIEPQYTNKAVCSPVETKQPIVGSDGPEPVLFVFEETAGFNPLKRGLTGSGNGGSQTT